MITAIYVILNPIISGANVAGDDSLVIIFTKFHRNSLKKDADDFKVKYYLPKYDFFNMGIKSALAYTKKLLDKFLQPN
ncbi:MAG: hypothetical protein ACR5K2_00830 [Wolbachia sp.]